MPGGNKNVAKKYFDGEKPNKDYKDTMNKLKNYWPESTIELYMSKAISLHDLDDLIVDEQSMADINKVVLNMDEWYKKNPEYSFIIATKLLKEKANIPTPDGARINERAQYPFRNRTRFERAVENDQYARRLLG